ncbi:tetratricopeptide repeat protein [Microscilla marina]|uniref:Serine/threonine kinase with GAF domain, putative n=1 Tax=Microscilla marina ATCC 23134 TaxID=313606 RepID=A1ZYL7_MICM2|nr:tetratricopeptide repeat protein [Microscilla marina]EAY24520.1 serine/threonine kinase with GAF domain, putative [Microscilla marina ATCC 23134]
MLYNKPLALKGILLIAFCALPCLPAFAWQRPVDKLLAKLEKHPANDRKKVDLLCSVAYNHASPKQARAYAQKALKLAKQLNYPRGIIKAYRFTGLAYMSARDFKKALHYYNIALEAAKDAGELKQMARIYLNIGLIYRSQAVYNQALAYMLKSLKLSEKLDDQRGIAFTCNNIGVVYNTQKNYPLSLKYYQRALKIKRTLGNKRSTANTIHNIGAVYGAQGKYDLAMKYSLEAAQIKKEVKHPKGLANSYGQIGKLYLAQHKYNQAIKYYTASLAIDQDIGEKYGITETSINLGVAYTKLKQYNTAKDWLQKGRQLAQKINARELVQDSYQGLAEWFQAQGRFEQALQYHQKYTALKDSLFNSQTSKQIAKMQVLYETEKKELENKVLKDEQAQQKMLLNAQKATIRQQKIITLLVVIGLLTTALLAFALFRQRQQKQKTNNLLKQKNEEIFTTNEILATVNLNLEAKNEHITASIDYAQHIQQAIFPAEGKLQQVFAHSFVYFTPLEIVSGDFYWLAELNTAQTKSYTKKVLAVVDCTGHGVPGAFMSLIATVLLKEAVLLKHIHSPELILNELHRNIRQTLKQKQNYNRDGMEIAVVVVEPETHTLEFAGARRPLVYVQDQHLHTIKGDRLPIGGEQRESERRFTKHLLYLHRPLSFYLFSDGYQDQFGGEHGKKMGSQRLTQLLDEVHHLPMETQQKSVEQKFTQWKGNMPQTDDVLVCGVRLD